MPSRGRAWVSPGRAWVSGVGSGPPAWQTRAVTRVIAGTAGGRRLRVPPGNGTRPTSDRAREGLFASLLSELGDLGGMHVLDLYAGSGAVGLEALSRGAGLATPAAGVSASRRG